MVAVYIWKLVLEIVVQPILFTIVQNMVEYTYNEKYESFKLSSFTWNNNDIFGCGIVYPPTNMTNEFPYVFFTQNGKQIGKGVLLKDNSDSYKPRVWLNCCSIEANFGNDLESKPFTYDVSKHLILKEFY
uniref:Uncharacterized protein n=1 Tax=Meloidogyne enterolobii TaxID=390850 RepID=A0A6V7X5P1_MELEN|nr:unnamed protein product [Meloidogyne enterolobii]